MQSSTKKHSKQQKSCSKKSGSKYKVAVMPMQLEPAVKRIPVEVSKIIISICISSYKKYSNAYFIPKNVYYLKIDVGHDY